MPEHYTYLMVDFCCIIVPFLFSFHPKINFYKQWRFFWLPCLVTAIIFLVWDVLFTKAGVWSFNPGYVCGIYFFTLPIEEYLFFICIPYAAVFTWFCIASFFNFSRYQYAFRMFSSCLILLLTITALFHLQQLYTSVTFVLLSSVLGLVLNSKAAWLPSFFISFIIILLPFFISNGILTGSLIKEPVVIYNNQYNLGIRMFTIPFEDTFYGMLLMLMNVAGFAYQKNKV
jgi:lycopene cyclase domain-containing protein